VKAVKIRRIECIIANDILNLSGRSTASYALVSEYSHSITVTNIFEAPTPTEGVPVEYIYVGVIAVVIIIVVIAIVLKKRSK